MRKYYGLIVLLTVAVLSMTSGFVTIDLGEIQAFLSSTVGIIIAYLMGGSEGNAGTGNGEDSPP